MKDFIDKEINISMLFLQNIRRITLQVITVAGETNELGSASMSVEETSPTVWRKVVEISAFEKVVIEPWLVTLLSFPCDEAQALLTAQHAGSGQVLKRHKLRPDVGLALPLNNTGANIGQLFTFLRLPLATGFPAHVHAFFSLTPSRQNLRNPGDNTLVKGSSDQ